MRFATLYHETKHANYLIMITDVRSTRVALGRNIKVVCRRLLTPPMMKDNSIAVRSCPRPCKFFGVLTPHVNVTRATNSNPKLLPLSTHRKQAAFCHKGAGNLAATLCVKSEVSNRSCSRVLQWAVTGFWSGCALWASSEALRVILADISLNYTPTNVVHLHVLFIGIQYYDR